MVVTIKFEMLVTAYRLPDSTSMRHAVRKRAEPPLPSLASFKMRKMIAAIQSGQLEAECGRYRVLHVA